MQITVWPEGWPVPNYIDPPTRGSPSLFIAVKVVTTIVIALRLYSCYIVTRSPGLDDAFLVAGFTLSIGQTFAEYKALTTWGWNMHLWDVPFTTLEYVRLSAWLNEFFFVLGTGCTKISVLLVYRRISNGTNSTWFVRLTMAAIAFTAIYVLAFTLEIFLVCRPLNSYWKSYSLTYTEKYTCGDERAPIVMSAALSALSDVYASILPMLLVRRLRLSKKQRISLFILFSFGLLTAGTGVARFYYLWKVTINYQPGPHTHDSTWLGWPVFAWTDIEANLAIICASAPALKVFFVKKLQPNLSKAYNVSSSRIARSRSRSSSKGIVQKSMSSAAASSRQNHRRVASMTISEVPSSRSGGRDVEAFPLEKIDEKPLPAWPVWESPEFGPDDLTTDCSSSNGEWNGDFLPIHKPGRQSGQPF